MLRTIGGAVLGYVAMALVVFGGLTAAYLLMGADRAFQPGVYDVSLLWMIVSIIVGFGAALLGGRVAVAVARSVNGPRILAGIVIVLGVALALSTLGAEPLSDAVRAPGVGPMEAMAVARTPFWMMLLNPVIGAIGVLVGGRAGRGAESPPPAAAHGAHA